MDPDAGVRSVPEGHVRVRRPVETYRVRVLEGRGVVICRGKAEQDELLGIRVTPRPVNGLRHFPLHPRQGAEIA